MGFFSRLFKKKPKDDKYTLGLHKTSNSLATLKEVLSASTKIDDNLYDSLEDIFIQADIGVDTVIYFIDQLKEDVHNKKIEDPTLLQEIIVDKMFEIYLKNELVISDFRYEAGKVNVYLFVGVNGVGKTTTIGKLANMYRLQGKKVLVVAADTFRAGATEQLVVWAKRASVDCYTKGATNDPSSVIYAGLEKAKKENYDIVLVDTAGRLQTKTNLMDELNKMHRVIKKVIDYAPFETLLVMDATTGQNGMRQAEVFKDATDVTGVILTKLDGTAKGGIVLAIRHQYGLPIKYVGLGEKIDDLVQFDIEKYIYGLFKEFF